MEKESNHVVPSDSGWTVRKLGSVASTKSFGTKEEAIAYGKKLSKKEQTRLYIHKRNGMVENRSSYGPPASAN